MKKLLMAGLACGIFFSTNVNADKVLVIPLSKTNSNQISFFVTLDADGEEKTIAEYGSLRIFARCKINKEDALGNLDIIQIHATSTEGPWYASIKSNRLDPDPLTQNAIEAGINVRLFYGKVLTGGQYFGNSIDQGSIIGPGGYYMSIAGETLGLGLNIYGHTCTAAGNILRFKPNNP